MIIAWAPARFSSSPLVWEEDGCHGARSGLAAEQRGRIASAVLRLGERASIKLPDLTMVVSRTLQDYYRARYGTEPAICTE